MLWRGLVCGVLLASVSVLADDSARPKAAARGAANEQTNSAAPADRNRPAKSASAKSASVRTATNADDADAKVTPDHEAAALAFVKEHHPELGELIRPLKKSNPREYRRAVMDLYRTSERMARAHERNPERQRLELQIWKLDSRLRLAVARLSMEQNEALEEEIRRIVAERHQARIEMLAFDADRTRQRLERIESQMQSLKQNQDKLIDQQVERLLKASSGRTKRPERKSNGE